MMESQSTKVPHLSYFIRREPMSYIAQYIAENAQAMVALAGIACAAMCCMAAYGLSLHKVRQK